MGLLSCTFTTKQVHSTLALVSLAGGRACPFHLVYPVRLVWPVRLTTLADSCKSIYRSMIVISQNNKNIMVSAT